jgi:hypothetical protein
VAQHVLQRRTPDVYAAKPLAAQSRTLGRGEADPAADLVDDLGENAALAARARPQRHPRTRRRRGKLS